MLPQITPNYQVDEYHELEEIHAQMKLLAANFPSATYVDSIGDSHDGNKIPIIKFGGSESKLTFWIQGCIHAREWISPATVMYATCHPDLEKPANASTSTHIHTTPHKPFS